MVREDLMEWRYTRKGSAAHAMYGDDLARYEVAFCGMQPALGDWWYGTGCQEEYERAAHLPRCRNCLRLMGRA